MVIPKIICSCGLSFDMHLSACPNCKEEVKNRVERLKLFCSQCGSTKHILLDDNKTPFHPDTCHACGFKYDNN